MRDDSRSPQGGGGLHGFLEAMYGRLFRGIATMGLPPSFKAYLKWSLGARAIIEVSHTAPVADFEPIAAKYPVFRVVPREG